MQRKLQNFLSKTAKPNPETKWHQDHQYPTILLPVCSNNLLKHTKVSNHFEIVGMMMMMMMDGC
jgi:hypothetical protein